MKKNRLLILVIIISNITVSSLAQFSLGIRAGAGMHTMEQIWYGYKAEMALAPRINVGIFGEFHFSPEFSFQPSLIFATKGGKELIPEGAKSSEKIDFLLNYIELPLNLLYNANLNDGVFKVGLGPYLGYGLSGKYKTSLKTFDIKFSNTYISTGSVIETYKPFDYGINALAGYEFGNGLSIFLNAQLGLANIYLEEDYDESKISSPESTFSTKNLGFYFTVGYKFLK